MSKSVTVFQDYFKANWIAGGGDYAKVSIGKYLGSLTIGRSYFIAKNDFLIEDSNDLSFTTDNIISSFPDEIVEAEKIADNTYSTLTV